jgi:hypothetical protein
MDICQECQVFFKKKESTEQMPPKKNQFFPFRLFPAPFFSRSVFFQPKNTNFGCSVFFQPKNTQETLSACVIIDIFAKKNL